MAICGASDSLWTCYVFVSNDFDSDELQNEDGFPYVGFQRDPLSLQDELLDANQPIQDPREYFSRIFKARMNRILTEWRNLIRTIDKSVKQYEESTAWKRRTNDTKTLPADLERLQRMNGVLRKLRGHLGRTIDEWKTFKSSPDGGNRWFQDLLTRRDAPRNSPACRVTLSFFGMEETFQDLQNQQQLLMHLEKSCNEAVDLVSAVPQMSVLALSMLF